MTDLLALLPWIAFAALAPLLLRRRPNLSAIEPAAGPDLPFVSVIVPARDEALNIGTCVGTLLDSDYPRREIVVVDDGSVDGTGEILRAIEARSDGGLRVIDGAPLPDGWIGKPWACWQGFQAARGDVLVFTDADTRHHRSLLGRAVAALDARAADLVSVLPRQRMVTAWERLIMPHIWLMLLLRYPRLETVNRTKTVRNAIANGQFIMVRRDAYEAVDGHRGVRGEVVEDVRMAQRLVAAGRRIFLAYAETLIETRMYHSLGRIVEGWSKNLATGSRLTVPGWLRPAVPWLVAAFLVGFWVVPPVFLLANVFDVAAQLLAWSAAATGISLVVWVALFVRMRVSPALALLYPVGALFAAGLFVRSAIRGGTIAWKGRVYRTGRGAR